MPLNALANAAPFVVVLVEDETLIRMEAAEALTEAGFVVIEAVHADAAIALLRSHGEEIHALFTDIQMPGSMDGLRLAHHTHLHWPWIALLLASGRMAPEPTEMPEGSRFLSKPYSPHNLVHEVRELVTGV